MSEQVITRIAAHFTYTCPKTQKVITLSCEPSRRTLGGPSQHPAVGDSCP